MLRGIISTGESLREAHVSIFTKLVFAIFPDELQPTESFRNVSDPQYEFGTLGGDDMGKAFA